MPTPNNRLADLLMEQRINDASPKKGLIDAVRGGLSKSISKPNDFSHNTVAEQNLKPRAPVNEKLWPLASDWDTEAKQREALYLALHGVDWAQTRHLSRNYDQGWHEQNPILGRNPSTDKVDAYMGLTALAHLFVADKLPPNLRKIFQDSLIGLEAGAVGNNEYRGIKAKF